MDFQSEKHEIVRSQLERILASPGFARANRSSQLLRYLVERTLSGGAEAVKEYSIGTQVFDKPESFDPRIDSLVRVEATRLRNRLQAYYAAATEDDVVEIALPVGTYVPTFRSRSSAEVSESVSLESKPKIIARWRWARLGAIGVAAFALVLLGREMVGRAFLNERVARLENLQRVSIPNEVLLSPVLGPGSTNLYFASNRGGSSFRIWRQSQDGSGSQPLTPAESDAFDLDISSDGAWLAYWSSRNGGGLYQLSAAGGDELLITSQGRSPRFSPTGDRIVFWKENRVTGFGSAYWSGIKQGQHDREPQPVVNDFDDAHTPQWTRDGLVILCGTRKTNIPEMEHDLWIVDAGGAGSKSTRIKTGILPFLKKRGINPHQRALPFTPFRFWNDDLIFAGMKQGKTALYALRLSPQDWRPQSEPVLLHEGLESDDTPYVRDSKVAFVSTQSNLNIWGIPLSVEGTASGAAQRLTEDGGDEFFPAVSLDGRVLVFVAWRPPNYQLWRKNLGAGVEEELLRTDDMKYLSLNAQGSKAVFRSMAGSFPQQQQIHSLDLATRQSSLTCANCGSPTSISPDGQFILHETGSQVARLAVLHVSSGRRQEILRHPNHPVQGARFSPDGKWLVFELDKGADGTQILAAPFRGLTDIPPTSWTELTDQRSSNFGPAWGPDGTSVYFLSERAGTRDLSMQKLDGKTKRAVGEAHPIYRFSNPSLTPLTYHVRPRRYVGLSVGKGRAALTLSELSSKVGIGRLQ